MKSKVYLETSFVSYLTAKLSQDLTVLQRQIRADALHIAVATVYGCEYLLTWNSKQINNAQIKREASRIIEHYGYQPTTICTPEELMGFD